MIDDVVLAWGSGVLAGFNPCGFALLPAWLAMMMSRTTTRPIRLGATMTAGFAAVFVTVGVGVGTLGWSAGRLGDVTEAMSVVAGVVLVLLGIAQLVGRKPNWSWLQVSSQPRGAFGYGVVFALSSLACAFPVFLAGVIGSFLSSGVAPGLAAVVAYTLGMGSLVTALAVVVARGGSRLVGALRRRQQWWDRIVGVLLCGAGVLVVARTGFDSAVLDDMSRQVSRFVDRHLPLIAGVAVATLVVVPTVTRTVLRRRR